MFLARAVLEKAVKVIVATWDRPGKYRLERVSSITRFLAYCEIANKANRTEINLAPGSVDRGDFIKAIGGLVAIDAQNNFVHDFLYYDQSQDFRVRANFLTTTVQSTRSGPINYYPSRPAPLLVIENESMHLHEEFDVNLISSYDWDKVSNAFAVWICRNEGLNDESPLEVSINKILRSKYGERIAACFSVTADGISAYSSIAAGVYSDEPADVLSLFSFKKSELGAGGGGLEQVSGPVNGSEVGRNVIIYGAPGTGKSRSIDQLASERSERTVFHADSQNSDFYGCLKPRTYDGAVRYEFVPGPFSRILKEALKSPETHYYLIVEELNRAPAAAVFGDLFQLLDRDRARGGRSTYEISFPNPEGQIWLNEGLAEPISKLYIPSNLSIYATMNSADQGVYPLDAAFRRRWEQIYMPLYSDACPNGVLKFANAGGELVQIEWRNFVKNLNDFLVNSFELPEDRLLGQWFVQEHELNDVVPSKILLYLWDDLLRHLDRSVVFRSEIKTFWQLDRAVKESMPFFSAEILVALCKEKYQNEPVFANGDVNVAMKVDGVTPSVAV